MVILYAGNTRRPVRVVHIVVGRTSNYVYNADLLLLFIYFFLRFNLSMSTYLVGINFELCIVVADASAYV